MEKSQSHQRMSDLRPNARDLSIYFLLRRIENRKLTRNRDDNTSILAPVVRYLSTKRIDVFVVVLCLLSFRARGERPRAIQKLVIFVTVGTLLSCRRGRSVSRPAGSRNDARLVEPGNFCADIYIRKVSVQRERCVRACTCARAYTHTYLHATYTRCPVKFNARMGLDREGRASKVGPKSCVLWSL